MKNKLIIKAGTILSALVILSSLASCAREISPNVYAADAVGEASSTFAGVIVHQRPVTVQGSESLEGNGLGIVGGGAGGALAGSQFGRGTGNTAATIGGGLLGATAGAFAEKALKKQEAIEYIVQLENGESKAVVQGPNPQFSNGQNVFLIVSKKGRSRIIAR